MEHNALADRLDLWGVDDDLLIYSDGSIGFALAATPLDIAAWDDDAINALAGGIGYFLNGLPDGLQVQFVQDIARGNETVLAAHRSLTQPGCDAAAQCLCDERLARLAKLDKAGDLPRHSLLVLVRRPPGGRPPRKRIFSKTKLFQTITDEYLAREVAATRQCRADLSRALESLPVASRALSAEEVLDRIYHQWNPDRAVPRPAHPGDDVRSSLLFTDAVVDERGFSLGRYHHRVISLKLLPDSNYAAMATRLRELPFD